MAGRIAGSLLVFLLALLHGSAVDAFGPSALLHRGGLRLRGGLEQQKFTAAEVAKYMSIFQEVDKDGDGEITIEEHMAAAQKTTDTWNEEKENEAKATFAQIDRNKDGKMNLQEYFEHIKGGLSLREILSNSTPEEKAAVSDAIGSYAAAKEFAEIDEDGDGMISKEEFIKDFNLHCMNREATPVLFDETVNEIFSQMDADGSGKVSLQEFCALYKPAL